MKAFILAAGLGERLRPLTNDKPKPLIEVGGRPLIDWHIQKLREAGIRDLVINCHWLADQLTDYLGDGQNFGVDICWSHEPELLDTGGGIAAARHLLDDEPFALISADVWSDVDYHLLPTIELGSDAANLVVVPVPHFAPQGDFELGSDGVLSLPEANQRPVTYSGIGVLNPHWISSWSESQKVFSWLGPLKSAVLQGQVRAQLHSGRWTDVGSPDRLALLRGEIG